MNGKERLTVKFIKFCFFTEMASPLKIIILPCLLSFLVLLGEVKPVLAKKGEGITEKVKLLEKSVSELKQKMKEQEEIMKEQNETIKKLKEEIKEQDARMIEQEERIKKLEECEGMYTHHRFMKRHDFLVFGLY